MPTVMSSAFKLYHPIQPPCRLADISTPFTWPDCSPTMIVDDVPSVQSFTLFACRLSMPLREKHPAALLLGTAIMPERPKGSALPLVAAPAMPA